MSRRPTRRAGKEINGFHLTGEKAGTLLSSYTEMKADGSTSGGCWIYTGVYADGVNQSPRRKPGREQNWVAPEWGWAWPANRRTLYNRASADPDGKPWWSERKAYVWWDEDAQKWTGHDIPDFVADKAPSYRPEPGTPPAPEATGRGRRVHHAGRTGKAGCTRRPACSTARCLPTTSRPGVPGLQPALPAAGQPDPAGLPAYATTSRTRSAGARRGGAVPVRVHHLPADRAPHRGRYEPVAAVPVRTAAGVLLRGVARAGPAAPPGTPRVGHDGHGPDRDRGPGAGHRPRSCRCGSAAASVHQIGLPYHWGVGGNA